MATLEGMDTVSVSGAFFKIRPMTNVVGLSYRDGMTFQDMLYEIRDYVNKTLRDSITEEHRLLIEQLNEHLLGYYKDITLTKEEWRTIFDAYMEDVDASLQALNDGAATNLVNNPTSKLRVSLDALINRTIDTKTKGVFVPIRDNVVIIGVDALGSLPDSNIPSPDGGIIAIGRKALGDAVDVDKSIAIGSNAMRSTVNSLDNTAIGDSALRNVNADSSGYSQSSVAGTRNIAIGGNAGRFVDGGAQHTFMGRNAGQNIAGGQGAVAIGNGASAGRCPVGLSGTVENWAPVYQGRTGSLNVVAVGNWAASRNTAYDNTALGAYALAGSVGSSANVAVGANALRRVDQDRFLTGDLYNANVVEGTYSQDGGALTLNFVAHGATTGDIVAFKLLNGASKTFSTDDAFAVVTSVPDMNSVIVKHPKARTASGGARLAGVAVKNTNTGFANANTAVGSASLAFFNGDVGGNTAVGQSSGVNIVSGGNNTIVGYNALSGEGVAGGKEITVADTTAIGQGALFHVGTDGAATDGNTALGYRAGFNMMGGDSNTFIGRMAGATTVANNPTFVVNNTTALGSGASISGDNQVQLGNHKTSPYAYAALQMRSDMRDKADIRDTVLGLDFIERLRPVDFRYNYREGGTKGKRYHHGLIAQEVESVISETGVDFGGFQDHKVAGGDDVLSIGYTELITPLIKAVQELTARVKELEG